MVQCRCLRSENESGKDQTDQGKESALFKLAKVTGMDDLTAELLFSSTWITGGEFEPFGALPIDATKETHNLIKYCQSADVLIRKILC